MYTNNRRLLIVTAVVVLLISAVFVQARETERIFYGDEARGCDFVNAGGANIEWCAAVMADFRWNAGETIIIEAEGNTEPIRFHGIHSERIVDNSDHMIRYTFTESGTHTISWYGSMPETTPVRWSVRCEQKQAHLQFSHAPAVFVEPDEIPQLVLEFGNDSQETLRNIQMVCRIDGSATFTGDVWMDNVFPEVMAYPHTLRLCTLCNLPPDENFRLSFSVDPHLGISAITCEMHTRGHLAASTSMMVGLR